MGDVRLDGVPGEPRRHRDRSIAFGAPTGRTNMVVARSLRPLPAWAGTHPGFNAGAGLRFRVGAASLYVEGRYHGMKVDKRNLTFLPFTVGVAF